MEIFKKKQDLKAYLLKCKHKRNTVGFVPTMGALHQGHISLVRKAKKKNAIVVVSIFVNPTQFDNPEDLVKYPKTIKNDINLLNTANCDVVFMPSVQEIYAENINSEHFDFDGLENEMEGEFRDGHFDGVGTIVKTFFEIIEPDVAYFGKKDFQQFQIVKKMAQKLQLPVKVKGCDIFREKDGLAMSSRNARLTKDQRKAAPFIYKTLKEVNKKVTKNNVIGTINWVKKQFKKHPFLELEYFTIADETTLKTINKIELNKKYRAFIAVFAGEIRLIDNLRLELSEKD